MNFAAVKSVEIPDGCVAKICSGDTVLWSAGILPSTYQSVEWIGTDGNAYFVSNFSINHLSKFTLYYTYSSPSNGAHMFGANGPDGYGVNAPRFLHRHGALVFNKNTTGGNVFLFNFAHDNTWHTYEIRCEHQGNINAHKDGSFLAESTFVNANVFYPFGVFCNNYNRAPASYKAVSGSKIKELRFVDETTGKDVFNPVPCYRKRDGVIGMFDVVSKAFFTNAGTGSFTKGADV